MGYGHVQAPESSLNTIRRITIDVYTTPAGVYDTADLLNGCG